MGDENRSRHLQRSIVVSSAIGILVVGVIVGLASVVPLYRHLKRVQEDHLMWILATKRVAIEDVVSKALETGTKISTLPEITEKLDNHTKAVVGRQDLEEVTQVALSHAVRFLPTVSGINIFDQRGHRVVQVGADSPELPSSAETSTVTTFFGPTGPEQTAYFAVAISVYDKAERRIGTNVVTFHISDLEKAIKDHGGLGRTGEAILYAVEQDRVVPIIQSKRNPGSGSQTSSTKSAFERALRGAALKQAGVLIPCKDHAGQEVITYTPIRAGQWGIAVKMDQGELYAPVFPHIMTTGGIVSVLVLLGTLGTLLLVHPLTGKLVVHADELERQVREKMKVIEDLYEHIVQSEKSKILAEHTAEVAHELRQPLAIVGGFARRMAKHFDSGGTFEEEQKESCRVILSEIQRLETILDGLIDFTKRDTLYLEKVNPNTIIKKVLRVYEHKLRGKCLKAEASLGEDVESFPLDSHRFEQVVRNLVSNAIEASFPDEIISIQTAISLPRQEILGSEALASSRYFEMRIRNSSPMIPPEQLKEIFSPFYTTKESGTGLGLTVSKKIVEDHKGSIAVKSDTEGTVFVVWLPVERTIAEKGAET